MKVALTIAGSDSGGGAGIQADLKTFHQFGVFGTSAITAITAQNTLGVKAWEAVDDELVRAQLEAVAVDLPPASVKTGMLANAGIIGVVARAISKFELPLVVVDPVMVATSGDLLIENDAVDLVRQELVPRATLVTPNADEARVLTGLPINSLDGMREAALAIGDMGSQAVLIKGGHVTTGDEVVDLLYMEGEFIEYRHPRLETRNTHGTGCTLSAAIAASLAVGATLDESVRCATDYVHDAMRTAPRLGGGHGPLNHFAGNERTNSMTSD